MFAQSDIVYVYDGSTDGFFTCVFDIFVRKEIPTAITPQNEWQPSFFEEIHLECNPEHASRVRAWLNKPENRTARSVMRRVWLCTAPQRELYLVQYFYLVSMKGNAAWEEVQVPAVMELHKMVVAIQREVEKYLGFVRFSQYGEVLVGTITPKNFVLPLLQHHFLNRLGSEVFLLYDKVHKAALLGEHGKGRIFALESLTLPPLEESEVQTRALWKKFYATIAIESRANAHLRRNLMPKRYWHELTEMEGVAQSLPFSEAARIAAEDAHFAAQAAELQNPESAQANGQSPNDETWLDAGFDGNLKSSALPFAHGASQPEFSFPF